MRAPRHLLESRQESNVGRRLRVEPGGEVSLLNLTADDASARVVSVVLTVSPVVVDLSALGPDEVASGRDEMRARGTVTMGSGGHQVDVEVDLVRGVAFSVPASALRVTATNLGTAPLDVGAFVTYGLVSSRATWTSYGPELGLDESWKLEVPAFATHVQVFCGIGSRYAVEVGRGRLGARWLYGQQIGLTDRVEPLPLANGCGQVRVTNRERGPVRPVAIFTLSL